jgi:hypothetical protein
LTVAVFATGMLFINWQQPGSTTQPVKHQEAQSQGHKAESPDFELAGSTWLTKDAAGFFTFGLVAVGIGQAVLFFIQLSYMRKGMDDAAIAASAAKEAADTAKIQAVIARETPDIMQDTAHRQLRAYAIVSGVARTKDPGELEGPGFAVLVDVENYGQTPAYDLFQWAMIEIREFPLNERLGIYCSNTQTLGQNE